MEEREGDNMSLLGYPDWAVDEQGNERPWVTGPSPISQALTAAGLGLLSRGSKVDPWIGGGIDLSGIGEAGLLGLDQYGKATQNLHGARKDFYDSRRQQQDQLIKNEEFALKFQSLEDKKKQFPNLIKELRAMNDSAINIKLPALVQLGSSDINSAYNAATNILSAVGKTRLGDIKTKNGVIYQEELGPGGIKIGEKYLAQDTKGDSIKLSTPEITGQLFNSSANLKDWNLGGQQGEKPGGLSVFKYNSMYREKMRIDKDKIKVTNKLGETKDIIKTNLIEGILDPTAYAIMKGMDTAKIKALGIDKPLIDTKEYTSEAKRTITEAKDIGKVGIIAQVENSLEKQTFDPTKISLQQYGQYFTGGALPLPGPARSYENMALAGSRMFGYLFSGATVKDDENRAMRMVLYPMPGDTPSDVARKLQFRQTVLELYKTYIPPDIGKKLFKKIIADADNNQVTTPEEISEIIISDNSTSQPGPELNSLQSEETLNRLWPE